MKHKATKELHDHQDVRHQKGVRLAAPERRGALAALLVKTGLRAGGLEGDVVIGSTEGNGSTYP